MKYEYDTVLHETDDNGGAYVVFPWDIRQEFGKGRVKVHADFDGIPYDGSIVNMGLKNDDGSICYVIGVLKAIRKELGKSDGDMIHVAITDRSLKSMWKCPKCGRSFKKEGQSHFCGKIETIDQYIEEQDEGIWSRLNEVRQILHTAIPEAQEKISWSMPTFWKGKNIIHFAASKNHLGLYPGGEATTVFADRLADYDVSKGTIRLPYNQPLPKELITDIAKWCYEQYAK